MLREEPIHVATKGRLYLAKRQRRDIDLYGTEKGVGTPVSVHLQVINCEVPWDGCAGITAQFNDEIRRDGHVRIPKPIREYAAVEEGDLPRVSVSRRYPDGVTEDDETPIIKTRTVSESA